MELARVIGQVVATVKQQGLHGMKLLVLVPLDAHGEADTAGGFAPAGLDRESPRQYVAVDYAGAGHGEVVLVAHGSAARIDDQAIGVPTDAAVVAIVDSIVLDHRTTFRKSG
jgi:carbon dioxide concentrating mechanism protein CcmL